MEHQRKTFWLLALLKDDGGTSLGTMSNACSAVEGRPPPIHRSKQKGG
jgi:hypothetical protein